MEPLHELLATDHRQTLEFFFVELRDISEPGVDREELLYNASVLAHFAQTSTQATSEFAAPTHLGQLFDHFVMDNLLHDDETAMESAGAQCLLLAGFFEGQMRVRHNIRWYSGLGASFFRRAAERSASSRKARLLGLMSVDFEMWRQRHARLGRELRDRTYLLPFSSRQLAG
jgi:hypothetical protein